ncbi:MAG: acyl-CoA synthetase [Candidatus Nanosalina sp. J07AB43]|nr:MAG: acyl-CoA synthetase [Candidatus Nanosalina sp. J07AB43]
MSFDEIFDADKIAVIGRSSDEMSRSGELLDNINTRFEGEVYATTYRNDTAKSGEDTEIAHSIEEDTDLAVIVSLASETPEIVEKCGDQNVDTVLVTSEGFSDVGNDGLESELRYAANQNNIQLVGPNSSGIISPNENMNASFFPQMPQSGETSLLTQDPGLTRQILQSLDRYDLGVHYFASVGNKAFLDETDLLKDWRHDTSQVILGQISGVSDGRKFMEEARKTSLEKPVVLMRQPGVGKHRSLEHQEQVYSAAFHQTGVVQAESVQELLRAGEAFSNLPIPSDGGTAVISNSEGLTSTILQEMDSAGLSLPELESSTMDNLENLQSASVIERAAVTCTKHIDSTELDEVFRRMIEDDNVGSVIVAMTPLSANEKSRMSQVLERISQKHHKPVAVSIPSNDSVGVSSNIDYLETPGECVEVLESMYSYRNFLERGETFKEHEYDEKMELEDFNALEDFENLIDLLESYGLEVPLTKVARSPQGAVDAASEIGFPVVLKIDSPDIRRPSDVDAVRKGIESRKEVKQAFKEIIDSVYAETPESEVKGVKVQETVSGTEVSASIQTSPNFGPYIRLQPESHRSQNDSVAIPPVSREIAGEMAEGTYEGLDDPADLTDMLMSLGKIALEYHDTLELLSLDLLIDGSDQVQVVDSFLVTED